MDGHVSPRACVAGLSGAEPRGAIASQSIRHSKTPIRTSWMRLELDLVQDEAGTSKKHNQRGHTCNWKILAGKGAEIVRLLLNLVGSCSFDSKEKYDDYC